MTAKTDNWNQVRKRSAAALTDEIVEFIEQCRRLPHPESRLISVLHRVQAEFGHIGATHIEAVAQLLQVPAAKVSGVATFYHFFRLEPRGRYVLSLCMGTACYVKGAESVARRIRDELGIDFGETTGDGMFTLEQSRCLGTCGLAPVLMVNGQVHAKVSPDQVPALLRQYRGQAESE